MTRRDGRAVLLEDKTRAMFRRQSFTDQSEECVENECDQNAGKSGGLFFLFYFIFCFNLRNHLHIRRSTRWCIPKMGCMKEAIAQSHL